jgi:hypothetical protein
MLPPKLQSILNAAGIREAVPGWQLTVTHSCVQATLTWNIASAPSLSHSSNQRSGISTVPTFDKPAPHRKHKSPSSRRRDRRRQEQWKSRTGITPSSLDVLSTAIPLCDSSNHGGQDTSPSSLQTGTVVPPSDIVSPTCASASIAVSATAAVIPAPVDDATINPFNQNAGPDFPPSIPNAFRSAIDPGVEMPQVSHYSSDTSMVSQSDNGSLGGVSDRYSDSEHSSASHCSDQLDCLPSDSDTIDSDIGSVCESISHSDASTDPFIPRTLTDQELDCLSSDSDTIESDIGSACESINHSDTSTDPYIPRTSTHQESQQSLDEWRTDVISWLLGDPSFVVFLDSLTWTRISKSQPFRGLSDDPPPGKSAQQKAMTLDAMLNRIAMLCPSIALRTVNSKCKSLNDVWQSIYVYYCCKL